MTLDSVNNSEHPVDELISSAMSYTPGLGKTTKASLLEADIIVPLLLSNCQE